MPTSDSDGTALETAFALPSAAACGESTWEGEVAAADRDVGVRFTLCAAAAWVFL